MIPLNLVVVGLMAFWLESGTAAECTLIHKQSKETAAYLKLKPLFGRRYSVKDDEYLYSVGICTSGMENPPDAGSTVAVWQQKLDEHRNPLSDSKPVKIGQYNQTDIKAGKNWVYLEYLEGEKYNSHCNNEKRKAVILITCDPEATDNTNPLQIIEEGKNRTEGCYYLFELAHPEVCEVETQNKSLSVGSIVLIVFSCVAAVYLIAGALYQRFVLGAKGIEQIPNYEFWKDFGNLQADGCDFICRSQNGRKSTPYKGVGDDQLDDPDDRDDNLLPM